MRITGFNRQCVFRIGYSVNAFSEKVTVENVVGVAAEAGVKGAIRGLRVLTDKVSLE